MSGADYYEIKKIIDEIVGDTQQGAILLKAIRGYFTTKANIDKAGQIKVVNSGIEVAKIKDYKTNKKHTFSEDAQKAMNRFTAKLKKENARYKKANCRASS